MRFSVLALVFASLASLPACGAKEDIGRSRSSSAGLGAPHESAAEVDDAGADGAADGARGGPMRVFVTSTAYDADPRRAGGASTGLEGADNLCNKAAHAAGLGGAWVAWLSDTKTNAIDRIADVSPWYLVDGRTRIFADKDALTLSPERAIDKNERGQPTGGLVWTGTSSGGFASGSDCLDWTSSAAFEGTAGAVATSTWTAQSVMLACSDVAPIYCFEQR
jgi:hypothetical protein